MEENHKSSFHLVALPYPGRGHVNPMLNLCNLLLSHNPNLIITVVLTEEWLGLIGSKPHNLRFATIPNVIPSERGRANDFPGFITAVYTKMEAPFEQLLNGLEPQPHGIVADTYMVFAVGVGRRRNIPVASLWTMSATAFSVFHHFELLVKNGHFPAQVTERGNEIVEYIPGVSPIRLADLPTFFYGVGRQTVHLALQATSSAAKASYLLFSSVYELEAKVIEALKPEFPFPLYSVGPIIPYFKHKENPPTEEINSTHCSRDYLVWLDSHPPASVLYVSLGSFLSVSNTQMDEIVAGIRESGVRFLCVARSETSWFKDGCGEMGMVVPWCDQLRVLCHPSVGGFWTHCGFNSSTEGAYAGVPMLTFPIFWDQVSNSKLIVDDWKIGWRMKKDQSDRIMTREEIRELVRKFMDLQSNEMKEMRERAKDLKHSCRLATEEGGSLHNNLSAFITDITQLKNSA